MRKVALILGGADCVWRDMGDLETLVPDAAWADYVTHKPCHACKTKEHRIPMEWPGPVIACNDIAVHFPGRIDHWCSLHPDRFAKWAAQRAKKGFPPIENVWAKKGTARTIRPWIGGSSGMMAATIAKEGLKCELGILCGIGLTNGPHFVGSIEHPYGKRWMSAATHWRAWQKPINVRRMQGWLRSMSGNTRTLLGAPDAQWLLGEQKKVA